MNEACPGSGVPYTPVNCWGIGYRLLNSLDDAAPLDGGQRGAGR